MTRQFRSLAGIIVVSALVTGVGVWLAHLVELALFPATTNTTWTLLVGFVEEAFVRFLPLILTFYGWSYWRGRLLSKTEGFLATVASGLTVAGLEILLKLEYLTQLEATVRFDLLFLPLVFVHLPFALLAGRFVYALGEQIHGTEAIRIPSLSCRTGVLLVLGYLVLSLAHVGYNVFA
jgi:hypothetical protein